ncbi:MAG TPA: aldo/keto reductase [Bacteroidales bacterium]|nr:aldo/keto reductase [Bacteroidales bacterium]HPR11459.1 aldo/keto reductase [Bacteroidales bacterium]
MVKSKITRGKFLSTALAGLAGMKLLPKTFNADRSPVPELREVGRTGIKVSPVCFGASRTNNESLIRYALDKGINFIDTGRSYANGNNEKLVGNAVSGIREKVVIQSKIRLDPEEVPSGGKGKKGTEEIKKALWPKIEASLKALNTEYIDILLYHDAREESLLFHPEVMKFYDELKSSGVIRAHGFSNHNEYLNLPERNNREGFYDVIMIPFNHSGSFVHSVSGRYSEWNQDRLIAALTEAWKKERGIIAMKTCSGGKYSGSPDTEPGFADAVKWVIRHPFVSSAAVAMASFEQVDDYVPLPVQLNL